MATSRFNTASLVVNGKPTARKLALGVTTRFTCHKCFAPFISIEARNAHKAECKDKPVAVEV
jgi:hypothetical protein